jgi:hypothetical protein
MQAKKMSVTGVDIRKYGADCRVIEYSQTEIVRDLQMPDFIPFGEDFVKMGEIKLGNPIHITRFNAAVKMKYAGLYIFDIA